MANAWRFKGSVPPHLRTNDTSFGADCCEASIVVLHGDVLDVVIQRAVLLEPLLHANHHLRLARLDLRDCLVYIILSNSWVLLEISSVIVILVFGRWSRRILPLDRN